VKEMIEEFAQAGRGDQLQVESLVALPDLLVLVRLLQQLGKLRAQLPVFFLYLRCCRDCRYLIGHGWNSLPH
jgi:hypothetical protein